MHPLSWGMTKQVAATFKLNQPEYRWILDAEHIMATTFGVSNQSAQVFAPFFDMAKNLTLFIDDGTTPTGFGSGRCDQTLLSIFAYSSNLIVHKQDYTQQQPIVLIADAKQEPFYITWHGGYVDSRTSLYNARANATSYSHFLKSIRYKKQQEDTKKVQHEAEKVILH